MSDAIEEFRFVFGDPCKFRDRERSDGNAARRPGPPLRAECSDERVSLRCRCRVVPQFGWTDRFAVRVKQHESMLLAGDRECDNVATMIAELPKGFDQRRPPGWWVLFGDGRSRG